MSNRYYADQELKKMFFIVKSSKDATDLEDDDICIVPTFNHVKSFLENVDIEEQLNTQEKIIRVYHGVFFPSIFIPKSFNGLEENTGDVFIVHFDGFFGTQHFFKMEYKQNTGKVFDYFKLSLKKELDIDDLANVIKEIQTENDFEMEDLFIFMGYRLTLTLTCDQTEVDEDAIELIYGYVDEFENILKNEKYMTAAEEDSDEDES